ncbi:MAG: hypothetical protein K8L91_01380 [Anaerolineae bacterium]|nr:hypothetical protein [Anaerolineae bacterium]
MQCKTFRIRLQYAAQDEQAVNEFLVTVTVKHIFASVEQGGLGEQFWSVLIFYEPAIH